MENDPRVEIIQYAESKLGARAQVLDCSKLVQNAYQKVGIAVGRSSRDQALQGRSINKTQAQKGDIIYFKKAKSVSYINHSGLVHHLSADTIYFIHRSSSRGVVIDHLFMPYFRERFAGVRQIISEG